MGNDETHKCPACGREMPIEIVSCAACGGRWEQDGRFVPFPSPLVMAAEPAVCATTAEQDRRRRILFLVLGIAVFDVIVGAAVAILFAAGVLG